MRINPRLLSSLLLLALSTGAVPALAGDCRALLRPLLLAAKPAPDALDRVRSVCQAEADAGDAEATYELSFFSLGLGGNWQPGQAIPLIRSAADRGVTEAQYWLAGTGWLCSAWRTPPKRVNWDSRSISAKRWSTAPRSGAAKRKIPAPAISLPLLFLP